MQDLHYDVEKYGQEFVVKELTKLQRESSHALSILNLRSALEDHDQGTISAIELDRKLQEIALRLVPLQPGDIDLLSGLELSSETPEEFRARLNDSFQERTVSFAQAESVGGLKRQVGQEGTSANPIDLRPHLKLVVEDPVVILDEQVFGDELEDGSTYQLRNFSSVRMHLRSSRNEFISDTGIVYSSRGVAIHDDRSLDVSRKALFEVIDESQLVRDPAEAAARFIAAEGKTETHVEREAEPIFEIEAGKKYKLRNGRIVLMQKAAVTAGLFIADQCRYNEQGFYLPFPGHTGHDDQIDRSHPLNVAGEWLTPVKVRDGGFYRLRNGETTVIRDCLDDPNAMALHSQSASESVVYSTDGDAFSLLTGLPISNYDAVEELDEEQMKAN